MKKITLCLLVFFFASSSRADARLPSTFTISDDFLKENTSTYYADATAFDAVRKIQFVRVETLMDVFGACLTDKYRDKVFHYTPKVTGDKEPNAGVNDTGLYVNDEKNNRTPSGGDALEA